jgi:signal transduction histidine kinase/FixJ family two-component response regulator
MAGEAQSAQAEGPKVEQAKSVATGAGASGEALALLREKAAHIHRNAPTGIIGGFMVACVLVAAFWPVGDHLLMLAWLGAGLLLMSWRLVAWRAYRLVTFTEALAHRWLRQATQGAGLSGVLWALGGFVFFAPPQFLYHVLFVYAVAMMGVTAMFSFSAHAPTFRAYFLPTTIPAVPGMLMQGTWLHFYVALGVFIFIAVTLRFFGNFNRMFVQSVRLGFENQALIEELTVQKEAAESVNLAKSRFLAAASHDLRQPMHALTLYMAAIEDSALPPRSRANLAHARACGQTMDEMFRALLDVSRLDAGAVSAQIGTVELAPLLERIRIEFEPQARAKGLFLRVRTSSLAVRGPMVLCDPELTLRILRNLTDNAIRYTARGGVLVGCRRVGTAGACGGAPRVRLCVADSGAGIAQAEQRQIFEEFYQVGNPERDRNKGIGLGLAIVERLARLMEARVTLRSAPGRGSLFSFELPLADGTRARPRPLPATQPVPLPAQRMQGAARVLATPLAGALPALSALSSLPAREGAAPGAAASDADRAFADMLVVVVDDEEPILHATREVLAKWGCRVITAASGDEACALLAEGRAPDLLICDYRLREHETGIDVIETLRSEFNTDIAALLVSGDSAPARMREAEANGLRVLHKPFDETALRATLLRVLDEHAQAARQARARLREELAVLEAVLPTPLAAAVPGPPGLAELRAAMFADAGVEPTAAGSAIAAAGSAITIVGSEAAGATPPAASAS